MTGPVRRSHAAMLALATWLSGSLACQQDPYVLLLSDASPPDVLRPDRGHVCQPSNGGIEACDGKDNDCDGQIDEDYKLATDPTNCGECGKSCLLAGALTGCELGACKHLGCAPGFQDLNQRQDDGCEYACTPTGPEVCDGEDNDCNGDKDETFDLTKEVENCGACGHACALANAVPRCEGSTCKIQSCKAGFIDSDKRDDTGCEKVCQVTNNGVETCDGLDNDCNGVVDDPGGTPIDFQSNLLNCGRCGVVCVVPNGTATCTAGQCSFTACTSGFVDADKKPENGCECQPTGGEMCDGRDNDCNGQVDDNVTSFTLLCGKNVGECRAGALSCRNGVEVCTGKVDPRAELCDTLDTDCDGTSNPPACLFPGALRERRLDDPGNATLGAHNSTQLHAAGTGSRILAVWLDRRNGRGDIYGNLSTDGGQSWGATDLAVASEGGDKLEPRVAFGGPASGGAPRAYVVYERFVGSGSSAQRNVFLRRSTDGGQTFSAAVQVEQTSASSGDALFVRLAVAPGASAAVPDKVVVCWERIALTGPVNPNLRCNLSADSGATFGASDAAVNATPNGAIVPELAVDAGYAYVSWQQGAQIRVARASLAGASLAFGNETLLSPSAGQAPQILADGTGRVVVIWEDLRDGLVNVRANRSADSGGSWLADGVRVDNDVVNGNSTRPVLAARPGGRVFAAWEDTNRGRQDIYVNSSDDGGGSWSPVARRVDGNAVGATTSVGPSIAVAPTGNNVYVAWEDYRNGAYRDIYFSLSLDGGVTWNVPDYRVNEPSPAGRADARSPWVFAGTARAAVLWIDNRTQVSGGPATGSNADIYSSYLQ